jgi:hypothetical protein
LNFPSQNLTNQFISSSYGELLQIYNNGSSSYILDGTGSVVLALPITASSSTTALFSVIALTASIADTASLLETTDPSATLIASPSTIKGYKQLSLSSSYVEIISVQMNDADNVCVIATINGVCNDNNTVGFSSEYFLDAAIVNPQTTILHLTNTKRNKLFTKVVTPITGSGLYSIQCKTDDTFSASVVLSYEIKGNFKSVA